MVNVELGRITQIMARDGILYVEARIRDNTVASKKLDEFQRYLQYLLFDSSSYVELGEDLLINHKDDFEFSGLFHLQPILRDIEFLKAVEYVGKNPDANNCYDLQNVHSRVQVYYLNRQPRLLEENIQTQLTIMPHVMFEGIWDDLIFDRDIKTELIWTVNNLIRFAKKSGQQADMNPLFLLYGPPGTGKTTLCQGLAQKISIRLSNEYEATKLIEIKTATLLSKYYSESARQVDLIFTKICQMCEREPKTFICVLIDEVESIANCREKTTLAGEAQDSLRATNALLTGIDRAKVHSNVIFLCTSNFVDCLDSAFLDRCSSKLAIDPPSSNAQYTILCSRLKSLMSRGLIQSEASFPSYCEAQMELADDSCDKSYAGKVAKIVRHIRAVNDQRELGKEVSGRALTQLPETAIKRYLREEECSLDMALQFMEQFVDTEYSIESEEGDKECGENESHTVVRDAIEGIEIRGKKRKLMILYEEDFDEEFLRKMIARIQDEKKKVDNFAITPDEDFDLKEKLVNAVEELLMPGIHPEEENQLKERAENEVNELLMPEIPRQEEMKSGEQIKTHGTDHSS